MVLLTENVVKRINTLVSNKTNPESWKLRLSVSGGGCFGFKYEFKLDDKVHGDDTVFHGPNLSRAAVVIDTTSLSLLEGSVIDYVEDLSAANFVIKNPKATSGCGCGISFSL